MSEKDKQEHEEKLPESTMQSNVGETTPQQRTPEEEAERLREGLEAFRREMRKLAREMLALNSGSITKH